MARRKQPVIPDQLLDQLLAGADAKTAFEKNDLLDELKAFNPRLDHRCDRLRHRVPPSSPRAGGSLCYRVTY